MIQQIQLQKKLRSKDISTLQVDAFLLRVSIVNSHHSPSRNRLFSGLKQLKSKSTASAKVVLSHARSPRIRAYHHLGWQGMDGVATNSVGGWNTEALHAIASNKVCTRWSSMAEPKPKMRRNQLEPKVVHNGTTETTKVLCDVCVLPSKEK